MARSTLLLLAVAILVALNLFQYLKSPRAISDREVVDRFTQVFFDDPKALWSNRYLGISTLQNPMDVWITQEILFEVKPDFIVETGTFNGGSALLWATLLEPINPDARIITVDIENKSQAARTNPLAMRKVQFLVGSSTDAGVVNRIRRLVEGSRVVVILDSDHSKRHVLEELRAYAPLVNVGSYLIVQDGVVNGHPIELDYGPGPWEAVDEFLRENDQFEIDHDRERLLLTYNPHGFLRRVR